MSDDRIRVLIAGGGVAALETMLALRTLATDLRYGEAAPPAGGIPVDVYLSSTSG